MSRAAEEPRPSEQPPLHHSDDTDQLSVSQYGNSMQMLECPSDERKGHGHVNGAAIVAAARDLGSLLLLADSKLSVGDNTSLAADVTSSGSQESFHRHSYPQRIQETMSNDFAMDSRLFLRAILALLAERDQLLSMQVADDSSSTDAIKIGYLRKASRRIKGLWKTKFVEIKKGTFSYFDASAKQRNQLYHHTRSSGTVGWKNGRLANRSDTVHQLVRKDIPLRTSTCSCRARSTPLVFELRSNDGRRRLWMANSREERQDWVQKIHNSMIGASVIRGDNFLQYQDVVERKHHGNNRWSQTSQKWNLPPNIPYREYLGQYLDIRAAIHAATTKDEYCEAISRLHDNSITVPVQWIKAQVDDAIAGSYFIENEISSCVEQLWKDLQRDTVEINGEMLSGNSFHGPERIVGKLTRLILSSNSSQHSIHDNMSYRITEAQAITYARDILLASGRTRSGGDSYFCAENLCLNRSLVVLCPSSSTVTPLNINVMSMRFQKLDNNHANVSTIRGIAFTRRIAVKQWMRQYLVLSNGVLSCYADDGPEPRTLLEKVKVKGAKVKFSRFEPKDCSNTAKLPKEAIIGHMVKITTNDGKIIREYLFEEESNFMYWHDSLKEMADIAVEYTNFDEKIANEMNSRDSAIGSKSECCTVDVVVNVCTEYKACTLDPSGIDSEDTWA